MIIDSLRTFIIECPLIQDNPGLVNVDNIGNKAVEYSVVPIPNNQKLKEFINGDSLRKYDFLFLMRNLTSNITKYIENQGFMEQFSDWLELQTEDENFPALKADKIPNKIYALNGGFLSSQDDGNESAIYQISCSLEYRQKGK